MLDVLALIIGAIGALGGAAGFLALYMQRQDRKARRRIAHIPPELRPVLIEIVDTSAQVAQSPRDREWCEAKVDPLLRRFEPLFHLIPYGKPGNADANVVFSQLHSITVHASHNDYQQSDAEVAMHAVRQRESAEQCATSAKALLRLLGSAA